MLKLLMLMFKNKKWEFLFCIIIIFLMIEIKNEEKICQSSNMIKHKVNDLKVRLAAIISPLV